MLVRNIIYSFTQSFTESFPVLLPWSSQMDNFHVVSAYFLCFVQIIQKSNSPTPNKCKRRFSSSFCFLIGSLFCVMITYIILVLTASPLLSCQRSNITNLAFSSLQRIYEAETTISFKCLKYSFVLYT